MFVVLDHVPLNQESAGLPHPNFGAISFRGAPSVKLFFALSGFLITHLLLKELALTRTIDVRRFYLRRVCRIWPLYFGVAALGLVVEQFVLPVAGYGGRHVYDWRLAAVLYAAFLPNLMNALAVMGGILNPLWSIGIEEQFYLLWAPALRRMQRHLAGFFSLVLFASLALFFAQWAGAFGVGRWKGLVDQLEFHYMAAGALAALLLERQSERLLFWVSDRRVQALCALLLVEYYFVGKIPWGEAGSEIMQLLLYPWLIVAVATAGPRSLVHLSHPATERLGSISYGIYMLHMPVVWATSFAFTHFIWWRSSAVLYIIAYYTTVTLSTLLVAAASYRWFESPFLRLKGRFEVVAAGAP